ncbi:E3 ubiquitin-protein ligase MIB2-like [Haliotis rufescens]|uniref:E3 ubiquitin-protein ligase MIB2-like n=1 Tax=Haliotis rufescens TaxID=6454 RepID=UPI00201EB868|nr:E3 ubiquitin-protein ligase MIB2-like [Haliotis rufescens]
MPYPCPGIRVVRGPGWSGQDQDGGDGHVGTVLDVDSTKGRVTVLWDTGREFQYDAGDNDKFDLLVFDSGPTAVQQKGVVCDGCREENIAGVRWKCSKCTDFDLCTFCYMEERHDVTHAFLRSLTRTSPVVRVPPRSGAARTQSRGMFKGATVIRGLHWRYGDQDGGDGTVGEIVKLGTYTGGCVRGAVNVRWNKSHDSLCGYRLGAGGQVALAVVDEANGWKYYKEHLPILDVLYPETVRFQKGDKVRVDVDLETFKSVHRDHIGYRDDMKRCLDDVGTVVRPTEEDKAYVRVQYEDAEIWAVMSNSLTKLHSFEVGDIVKITSNYNAAVDLQVGHGGWTEHMADSLGKQAEVIAIDRDCDLKVKVDGRTWVFSPVSCTFMDKKAAVVSPPSSDRRVTTTTSSKRTMSTGGGDIRDLLAKLRVSLSEGSTKQLIAAAQRGDVDKVKAVLRSLDKTKIDDDTEGVTALHTACFLGHLDIVTSLLSAGSDKNRVSKDGNTPLHYAVSGDHADVVEALLKAKAEMDIKNTKAVTPLHLAVVKEDPSATCATVLVKHGSDPNTQDTEGDTPLHDAITSQDKDLVKVILQCRNINLQLCNTQGLNPFHLACRSLSGDVEVPRQLIQKDGGVVNSIIRQGQLSPLHIAVVNEFVGLAGLLISADAKVNACDENGKTPLHLAVHRGNMELVALLTESNADLNIRDSDGNTPLHAAHMDDDIAGVGASRDEDAAVAIRCHLAENGGNVTLKNKDGKTPLDLVKNKEVRVMLEKLARQPRSMLSKTRQQPAHWTSMGSDAVKLVPVTAADPTTANEHRTVTKRMQDTLYNKTIVAVQRVQNIKLWEHYAVAKARMEESYGKGQANEQSLFHGTTPDSAKDIPIQNIDFRLSGNRVGALFGLGAYFAVDAKYSDNYTKEDVRKHRFMFLAKVLVGRTRKGAKDMTRPPVFDLSDKTKLADSTCDDELRPRVYVIFSDKQIYPEYLVEYE